MPNHSLLSLIFAFLNVSLSYTPTLMAHAGIDHGKQCFISVGDIKLRLGGVQAKKNMSGNKHYCHLFPEIGDVIFTFEKQVIQSRDSAFHLKLLATRSYWDILTKGTSAFNQTLTEAVNDTIIHYHFKKKGLYVLEVNLQSSSLKFHNNKTQTFLFLVGFPLIKILVIIAFGFLILLGIILLKQLQAGAKNID